MSHVTIASHYEVINFSTELSLSFNWRRDTRKFYLYIYIFIKAFSIILIVAWEIESNVN